MIRTHLTKTLLMEKEDVDYMPIFTREGASWGNWTKFLEVSWRRLFVRSTRPLLP